MKRLFGNHTFIIGFAQVVGPGCVDVSHTLNCLLSSLTSSTGFPFGHPLLSDLGGEDESPHPSSNLLLHTDLVMSHTNRVPYTHVIFYMETGVAV